MKTFLLLIIFASLALAQPRYEIINLESSGFPANDGVFARGINSSGQVVGDYWTPGFTQLRLFTYTLGGGIVDLGPAPSTHMISRGINDAGQLIAAALTGGSSQAYRYTPGIGYEVVAGGPDSEPFGINNRGQVTGFTTTAGNYHMFRYTDGVGLEDLGPDLGSYAINDNGSITGITGGRNIFVYQDGVGVTLLGRGEGRAINNHGVIAGNTSLSPVGGSAFIYVNGEMQLLGNLGGPTEARAMNNNNEIVGEANLGRAFVWSEQNGIQDLNELIAPDSGVLLSTAFSINDHGQIVCDGLFNGKSSAFLLNPIPEPSTWALLALGTGTLLLLRRRK